MNAINTPKLTSELSKYHLDYIPEAHCYLKINNQNVDFTSPNSNFETIKNDIIQEKEIQPTDVLNFKVNYHKKFLQSWLIETHSPYALEQLWEIRERCIQLLSI